VKPEKVKQKPKTYQLSMAVAPHIATKLKKDARRAGTTLANYIRMLLAKEANREAS